MSLFYLIVLIPFFSFSAITLEKNYKMEKKGSILFVWGARINNGLQLFEGVSLVGPCKRKGEGGYAFLLAPSIFPEIIEGKEKLELKFTQKKINTKHAHISTYKNKAESNISITMPSESGFVVFPMQGKIWVAISSKVTFSPEDMLTRKWILPLIKQGQNASLITLRLQRNYGIKINKVEIPNENDEPKYVQWIIRIHPKNDMTNRGSFSPATIERGKKSLIFNGHSPFLFPGLPYIFIPSKISGYQMQQKARFPRLHVLESFQGTVIDPRENSIVFHETKPGIVEVKCPDGLKLSEDKGKLEIISLTKGKDWGKLENIPYNEWTKKALDIAAYEINKNRYGKKAEELYDQVSRQNPFIKEHPIWKFYAGIGAFMESRHQKASFLMPKGEILKEAKLWHIASKIYLRENLDPSQIELLQTNWGNSDTGIKNYLGLACADYFQSIGEKEKAKKVMGEISKQNLSKRMGDYLYLLNKIINFKEKQDLIIRPERGFAYEKLKELALKIEILMKFEKEEEIESQINAIRYRFEGDIISLQAIYLSAKFLQKCNKPIRALANLKEGLFLFPHKTKETLEITNSLIEDSLASNKMNYIDKIAFFEYVFPWIAEPAILMQKLAKEGFESGYASVANQILDKYGQRIELNDDLKWLHLKIKNKLKDFNENAIKLCKELGSKAFLYLAKIAYYTNNSDLMEFLKTKDFEKKNIFMALNSWHAKDFLGTINLISKEKETEEISFWKILCSFLLQNNKLFKKTNKNIIKNAEYKPIVVAVDLFFKRKIDGNKIFEMIKKINFIPENLLEE